MKKILLFQIALMCILAPNCQKEPNTPPSAPNAKGIEELSAYWANDFDKQRLFQLRLAFAKTVARAFEDIEFARYFKERYGVAKDMHFDELFFGTEAHTPITASGLTLYEHLKRQVDSEVMNLFGEDFLDLVLRFDPCVVIKLPDIFRSFDWDLTKCRPVVIAQLPFVNQLDDVFGPGNHFVAYHLKNDYFFVENRNTYFHVTIKYSEDYALTDKVDLLTERAKSFYEFIPQAERCGDGLKTQFISSGKQHVFFQSMVAIKKLEAFFIWQKECGYKGDYWHWRKPPVCQPSIPECYRECIPEQESVFVLSSVNVFDGELIQYRNNIHFDESYTYSWTIFQNQSSSSPQTKSLGRFAVPALPHEWFDNRSVSISYKENPSLDKAPKIAVQTTHHGGGRNFFIDAVFANEVKPNDIFVVAADLITYAELEEYWLVGFEKLPFAREVISASLTYSLGYYPLSGCSPGLFNGASVNTLFTY